MRRINAIVLGQTKDLGVHILIETLGATLLEVSAATAAYQHCVPSEDATLLIDHVTHASIGVSRCGQCIDRMAPKLDTVAFLDVAICLGTTGCCNNGLTTRQLSQPTAARDVICMHVRVNCGMVEVGVAVVKSSVHCGMSTYWHISI